MIKNGKDSEGSFKVRCAFCHELHYSASCEKVTDRDSRLKLLRDSNRCFVCLKIGHRANMCDITKKCRHCSGRHHQSICNNPSNNRQQCDDKKVPENRNSNKGPEGSDPPTTAAVTQTTKGSVLLQTARATVSNGSRLVPARILFDTGSQRSYIRKSLQNRLRLNPIGKETLELNTFGESKSKRENCEVFKVNIANKNNGESIEITAIGFPTICAQLPAKVNISEYSHLDGLELADFNSCDNSNDNDSIVILVGADHYWDIVIGDVIHGGNSPTAVSSKLGWLLSGPSKQPQSNSNTFSNLILTGEQFDNSSTASDQDELTTSLKRFWEVESVSSDSIDPEIPSKQQDFVQNIRFTGARYAVGLPWKCNDHNIEDDYEPCCSRLTSLHQKLLKDPKYLDEYHRNIEEQLTTGIVEKVPPSDKDQKNIHYLAHHGVIRKDKATTKLRVVYDGSAKTFRAASAEIRKLCRADEVLRYLTNNQITWQFIVEKAPWWGRFWERLIRSVKRPLRKVIGRTNLSYDELQRLVVEIEGTVNARPITYVYDDTESISFSLTPSHLVYGRRITTMPNSEHYEIVNTYQRLTLRAKHHRNLLESVTKQWKNEYLLAFREQSSTRSRVNRNPEIALGDIAIIRNDQVEKVEQLLRGEDGVPRAAVVRVLRENSNNSQLLRRSIQHLIPIEVRHESETDGIKNAGQESDETENAQVLRPTERPQRNAAITGQLRRLKQMGKL